MFLILHGWQGSGPDHWQTWLADRLRRAGHPVSYPELPEPDAPLLEPWLAALRAELRAAGEPPVVVCHSLACVLWLRHAGSVTAPAASRVLLVAPPSPNVEYDEVRRFFPHGASAEAVARAAGVTRLVCSDDDPYCQEGARALYGEPLAIETEVIPGGGHINPDRGYGPWPEVEQWCLATSHESRVTSHEAPPSLPPPRR